MRLPQRYRLPIDSFSAFSPVHVLVKYLVFVAAALVVVGNGCSRSGIRRPAINNSSRANGSKNAASAIFRNVSSEAGLNYRWGHGGKAPLDIVETLGHGCAFLDYDRDGLLDILLVGNRKCVLYHNQGGGRFQDVTAKSGLNVEGQLIGLAVGDFDNDSFPDVFVTGYGVCALYHNRLGSLKTRNGPTTTQRPNDPTTHSPIFEDVTAQAGVGARHPYDLVTAAAFVDLDGDGRLDLLAGRYILIRPETIHFCTYHGVLEGCGVKNYDPDFPLVYRNQGDGTFKDFTKAWGFDSSHGRCLGVAVCAADSGHGACVYSANDELAGDLFVPSGSKYRNIGISSGTAYNRDGLTQGGMGADWGDYNGDGRPDLIVTTFQSEPTSLYRNDGHSLFTETGGRTGLAAETTSLIGWAVRFFDYDNDGYLDLLMTNGHTQVNVRKIEPDRSYAQPMLLFHNEGGRLFHRIREQAGPDFERPFNGRGGAFGDFDNDGRVDALLVDEEGPAILLKNQDSNQARWIGVKLIGSRSNRDGIGARVTVIADGQKIVRDKSLCGGYLSAHDPRLHFGLGSASKIEQIVVQWPDSHTDTIRNPPLGRYITITEAAGLHK